MKSTRTTIRPRLNRPCPGRWANAVRLPLAAAFLSLLALTGCAGGLSQEMRQSLVTVAHHQIEFPELAFYAQRSNAAYTSEADINAQFAQVTRVATVEAVDVLYFVETDESQRTQTVTVRGTDNKPNIWQDIEIALIKDSALGVDLHRGFRDDASAVYRDLKPHVKKGYAVRLTGHSLGAAIAMILAGYLAEDGYKVDRLVTFGQPKITDSGGANRFGIRVTRVVHDEDVVPMVPPSGFPSAIRKSYEHVGPELILREGRDYVYLDAHHADRLSVGDFWRNAEHFSFKEHHMRLYLANIEEKVRDGARQVPYLQPGRVASGDS